MNKQLLDMLSEHQLLSGEAPHAKLLKSPWYVKIIQAFSGWLAAIFMLGFLGTLFSSFLMKNPLFALVLGMALVVTAYFILRSKGSEFLESLALALSLAGQGLIIIAIDKLTGHNEEATLWLLIALIQIPLAIFMSSYVHRVYSAFIAGIGFALSFYFYQNNLTAATIYSALLLLITALLWLKEFQFSQHIGKLQAVGYGLVLALITLNITRAFTSHGLLGHRYLAEQTEAGFQPWMGELLFSAVTLFVVWKLLQKAQPKPKIITIFLALGGTLLLALLSTQAHGIIIGVMIILLGFSASNRILLGLGIFSLLYFISHYYYSLENTLLNKSITLLALGILLIITRMIMLKLVHIDQKDTSQ